MSIIENSKKTVSLLIDEYTNHYDNSENCVNYKIQSKNKNANNANQNATNANQKTAKKQQLLYICEKCDFVSNRKSNYIQHIQTRKHKANNETNKAAHPSKYNICYCGKKYKHKESLSRHKKKCTYKPKSPQEEQNTELNSNQQNINDVDMNKMFDMFLQMITVNKESITLTQQTLQQTGEMNKKLVESITDISKKDTITSNSNNSNSNNTFNLNTFLNVTCKDAKNIEDVISSIDFDIANISIRNVTEFNQLLCNALLSMPENLRSVHCTDVKRKIVVVKHKNEWRKRNEMDVFIDCIREEWFRSISKMDKDKESWLNNDKLQETRNTALKYGCGMYNNTQQYNSIYTHICKNTTINKQITN